MNNQKKKRLLIIGSGPGGLMAAETAAELGLDVLVLEKNNGYKRKPCAEAVTGKTIARFPFIYPTFEKAFKKAKIISYNRTAYFRRKTPFLISINRALLHSIQVNRALAAGAKIEFGRKISKIKKDYVITEKGQEYKYDYLIGADGGTSVVRRSLGIPTALFGVAVQFRVPKKTDELIFAINPRKFEHTYTWIFPHRDYTSVGTSFSRQQKAAKFIENLKEFCEQQKIDWRSAHLEAGMINTDFRGYRFGDVFLVGESSGLISSFTGEGIYNSLVMGREVAKQIAQGSDKMPRAIEERLSKKHLHEMLIRSYYVWPGFCSLFYRLAPELKILKE